MKFCSFTHSIPFSYGLFFRHIKIPAQLPAKHHWSLSACFWTRASTRGGKWRQEGSHVSHTSGTRSCKCLQEAAVGIVCQETNQLPPFYLRSSWCHPSSPHEMGEQLLDQTSRVCGDRQPHPKEPWGALGSPSWGAAGCQHTLPMGADSLRLLVELCHMPFHHPTLDKSMGLMISLFQHSCVEMQTHTQHALFLYNFSLHGRCDLENKHFSLWAVMFLWLLLVFGSCNTSFPVQCLCCCHCDPLCISLVVPCSRVGPFPLCSSLSWTVLYFSAGTKSCLQVRQR